MNLEKLFEKQRELDTHILLEKGLVGQDLLDKKILALQVELGELANEWRGFKFWSNNKEPRNYNVKCHACSGMGYFYQEEEAVEECMYCDGSGVQEKNPLLEEYVDCLHFILSIGNDLGMRDDVVLNFTGFKGLRSENIVRQFNELFYFVSRFQIDKDDYYDVAMEFFDLGEMLGFTWSEIEKGYYAKNAENHRRQESGY